MRHWRGRAWIPGAPGTFGRVVALKDEATAQRWEAKVRAFGLHAETWCAPTLEEAHDGPDARADVGAREGDEAVELTV